MNTDNLLQDRIALVTGARRGIGHAIALAFAKAGADVALSALTEDDKLVSIANEITKIGCRSIAITADISRQTSVENMIQKVFDYFGRIDIMINSAGIYMGGETLLACNYDNWNKVLDVNLKGTYYCCQAVCKMMVLQKSGNIINIASTSGIDPRPANGAYSISKAGVIMLTRQLAMELAEYRIRVNAIAPGLVKTDMNLPIRSTPEIENKLANGIQLGRLGEVEDISNTALFLASEVSAYMTGQVLVVDGGGERPALRYRPIQQSKT